MVKRTKRIFNCLLIAIYLFVSFAYGHEVFSAKECLSAHNELRKLHLDTENLIYSSTLEDIAKDYVKKLSEKDDSIDVQPARVLPKRRRRHESDVDSTIHLESWDGEISFPKSAWDRNLNRKIRIGESIHKFCCISQPHCPKRFFHNLLFPPSAKGVVEDWYKEEISNYDFKLGQKKSFTSDISHFSNIVWKKTKSIGCAQSKVVSKCVFTVVIYEEEGGNGTYNDFKNNIAPLDQSSPVLLISMLSFFVILIIGVIILCYFCRENIRWKYLQLIIKIDTLKSEQELETDSIRFWWLRMFRKSAPRSRKSTLVRPKNISLKERPTIEVIINTAPQLSVRKPLIPNFKNLEDPSKLAIRYKGISQKAPNESNSYKGYTQSMDEKQGSNLEKQQSMSGKPPPPPIPYERLNVEVLPSHSSVLPVSRVSNIPKQPPLQPLKPPQSPNTSTPIPKSRPKPVSLPILDQKSDDTLVQPITVKNLRAVLEDKNKELPSVKKPLIPPKRPGSNI